MFPTHWLNALSRLFLSGYGDKRAKIGKHAGGTTKPKDWREKKRTQRKIAKQSRRINRQRGK